ncbi:hypothetical protein PFUGPA_05979 [Plasmodium falciparum Palo Alto/Uganda]|uniref:Erythrocyte membrane protein 1 n=2 Tax=Plasmodium falciparum TaxID=5833 RepID=W4IQL8_PLAFP|nr:hypothetical protein PFUGPA_05979 [Plasmodium falciparum Palo Alto/Uganda]
MGHSYSHTTLTSDITNESHKSARNVLEKFALRIKNKATNDAKKHTRSLKGDLKRAKFNHDFFKIKSDMPGNPCYLDFAFHSNTPGGEKQYRHPCARSMNKNLFNLEGAVCTNSKIKGNEEKINGAGACAPYRRRHICDLNLEHIDVHNVQNIHDLLGNVLVTAKYEGESIVEKHPNRGSSEVCTALARSFADIGDIVRGKDLFLGNNDNDKVKKEKLRGNLVNIFKKFKEKYKDLKDLQIDDIREYWWALNREDVWKALTCSAPYNAHYFIKSSDKEHSFSNEHCGHYKNGDPLTNLDYVPQFLRWFDEWADDFCRIRNHKLQKVKEACRDERRGKYCSLNGFDCTQTIWKKGVLHWSNECTDCSVKCNLYEIWLGNQREAFRKQKEKYAKEIEAYVTNRGIPKSSINNEYYGEFYKILKNNNYETANEFINLLNEGRYCKKQKPEEENIDFTKTGEKDTFYRSDYCQVCPDCGVICDGTTCKPKEKKYPECLNKEIYTPNGAETTEINVINSGDKEGYIFEKLEDFCINGIKSNGKNYEQWKCYYKHIDDNKCKMVKNSGNNITEEKIISFDEFFYVWVRKLLIDSIKWENELNNCIDNTSTHCNKECNKNCVCFDKWVKKKEDEWKNVKNVFENKNGTSHNYYNKLNGLFKGFFFEVMNEFKQDETKWNKLKENIKQIIDSSKENIGTGNTQDTIKVLLDHLKETATICKDNNANEACDSTVEHKPNPCGHKSGKKLATVKQIAQYYKRKAHVQLEERGGRRALKGDASKGTYKQGGTPSDFKDINKIREIHSNAEKRSLNPCHGKDGSSQRFNIGTDWKDENFVSKTHKDVYMPPRRQHFCTSNLEYLINGGHKAILNIENTKINHSFLGDVLLAAKFQAQHTMNDYKPKNDKEGKCRAIRYSFADLGDIIKGTDLWDKDGGEIKTQNHLVTIFGKIKGGLSKDIKGKYTGTKHLELRKDWWEANRDQIWKAMKCHIKDLKDKSGPQSSPSDHCGYTDHTPLDDYIPQRLRWMTEWAEWYCKAQSQVYNELMEKCDNCKNKNDGKGCMQNDSECKSCTPACKAYKSFIDTWQPQWDKIRAKYKTLYSSALVDIAANGGLNTSTAIKDNEDKPVIEFLFELYKANGGTIRFPLRTKAVGRVRGSAPVAKASAKASAKAPAKAFVTRIKRSISTTTQKTPYNTAAGYIHQEAYLDDCVLQKQFCKNKIGSKASVKDDTNYAFRLQPHDYDEACDCEDREGPKAPKEKKEDDVYSGKKKPCDIVEEHFKLKKNNTGAIDSCNPKKDYPPWKNDKSLVDEDGVCMPPRRQKLCVINLEHFKENTSDDLRKAFIKCAAAETYLLWQKYKEDNNGGEDLQNQLKSGKIPEDFKRQMFYTFGDYRDFLFGTDISKLNTHTQAVKTNIDRIFPNSNAPNDQERKKFWEKNAESIWQGMLCALSYNSNDKKMDPDVQKELNSTYNYDTIKNNLEDFANRPQFLRWFIEWSDEFCREQKKQLDILKEKCPDDTCTKGQESKKEPCKNACEKYQQWLKDWKENYKTQSEKYFKDKAGGKFQSTSAKDEVTASQYAYGYLNKALTKLCGNGNCKCMDGESKETTGQPDNSHNSSMPASLDDEPQEVKGRCKCPPPPDACKIVDGILTGKKETDVIEECKGKYKDGKDNYPGWNCKNKIKNGQEGAYMPPRRQKLCVINLKFLNEKTSPEDLRKAFIQCAAVETFFLWHKYKTDNNGGDADTKLNSGTIPEDFKRQMFYTFGDYRDLCLDKNIGSDVSKVEKSIKSVFSSNGDKTPNGQSRLDWWDEHKEAIWEGMLCGLSHASGNKYNTQTIKNNNTYSRVTFTSGSDNPPTLEEFAKRPQFLRWMIEWSEHFCKEQKKKYTQLVTGCNGYECNGKNGKDDKKEKCENACKAYKQLIEKWRPQWTQQSEKYQQLYNKAAQKGTKDSPEEEKHVVEYMSGLIRNSGTSDANTYNSAGAYVKHQGYISDCQQQKDFNSNTNNDNYAFRSVPHDHEDKCNCKDDTPSQEKQKEYDDVCNKVKTLIQRSNGGTTSVDGCGPKTVGKYPGWDCTTIKVNNNPTGACIPPRRRKLCVSGLTQEHKITKIEDIRTQFITCAAIETHFAWHRYKRDNGNAESELKTGKIPDDFLRSMKYTFGDFRDIFFGTDITSHANILKVSEKVKKKLKEKNGEQKNDEKLLEDWWDKNGPKIWNGMLCALTHDVNKTEKKSEIKTKYSYEELNKKTNGITPLEEFAERPQFLRWFTEWGDEFCAQRKKLEDKAAEDCREAKEYEGCNNKTGKCSKACEAYKNYITGKENEYTRQKGKFDIDKNNGKEGYDGYSEKETHDYLKDKCFLGTCNCIGKVKSITDYWKKPNKTYERSTLENRCQCEPPPPLAPPPQQPRPPAERPGGSGHDHRARSDGGQGPLPARPPRPPAPPARAAESLARSLQPIARKDTLPPADPGRSAVPSRDQQPRPAPPVPVPQPAPEGRSEHTDKNIQPPGGGGGGAARSQPPLAGVGRTLGPRDPNHEEMEEDDDDDDNEEDDEDEEEEEEEDDLDDEDEDEDEVGEEEEEEGEDDGEQVDGAVSQPEASPTPLPPLPSDNTSDILKTTIPFGIALALTSIAFFFMKVIYIYLVFMCLCVYVIYIYLIYLFIL